MGELGVGAGLGELSTCEATLFMESISSIDEFEVVPVVVDPPVLDVAVDEFDLSLTLALDTSVSLSSFFLLRSFRTARLPN